MLPGCISSSELNKQSLKRMQMAEEDFKNNKNIFHDIVEQLMQYEYPIIYIEEKSIITDGEQTINSIVSKDILSQKNGIKLSEMGYTTISKDHNGIYFYNYIDFSKSCGIMYYQKDFNKSDNIYIVKSIKIDDGWYYFEER